MYLVPGKCSDSSEILLNTSLGYYLNFCPTNFWFLDFCSFYGSFCPLGPPNFAKIAIFWPLEAYKKGKNRKIKNLLDKKLDNTLLMTYTKFWTISSIFQGLDTKKHNFFSSNFPLGINKDLDFSEKLGLRRRL